jgi:hypothetical protein|uniref:Uncharacterized protein n=1 Tax=viral metagenome TaxID=1070528 RepID=A0A6H2A280_9ZZZZ
MKKINLNDLALKITAMEGKKVQISNAQVKEALKCACMEFANYRGDQILEAVFRIADKYKKR